MIVQSAPDQGDAIITLGLETEGDVGACRSPLAAASDRNM